MNKINHRYSSFLSRCTNLNSLLLYTISLVKINENFFFALSSVLLSPVFSSSLHPALISFPSSLPPSSLPEQRCQACCLLGHQQFSEAGFRLLVFVEERLRNKMLQSDHLDRMEKKTLGFYFWTFIHLEALLSGNQSLGFSVAQAFY